MATTAADIQAAKQQIDQAEAALDAARAKQQEIASNPDPQVQFTQAEGAKVAVQAAKDKVQQAISNYNRTNAAYNLEQKQHPDQKPLDPIQQQRLDSMRADEEAKQRNARDPEVGARVDDATANTIRRQRAEARNGKPPRTDSPVQQQEAGTHAAAQAETARHQRATEGQQATETQVQAQIAAVNASRGILSDTMTYETNRARIAQDAQESARSAAQGLLSADVTMRGQDQNHIQTRASFLSGLFNNIMSAGLRMMQGLPKGDQTAVKFVRAALTYMDELYHQAGLDKDLPRPDRNSVAIRTLETVAGTASATAARLPSAELVSTEAAVLGARIGAPNPGWNGEIGEGAADYLADVDAARAAQGLPPSGDHGPVRPGASTTAASPGTTTTSAAAPAPVDDPMARRGAAAKTEQGRKLFQQYITPDVQAIHDRQKADPNSVTNEEKIKLQNAQNSLNAELDRISPPPAAPPANATHTPTGNAPPPTPGQADPNRKPETASGGSLVTPGKDLSYDAMFRQIEAERAKQAEDKTSVSIDDRTTAQEAIDRLRAGEKPLITSYNNENDAATGNAYDWKPKTSTDMPKINLAGPPEEEPSVTPPVTQEPLEIPKLAPITNLVDVPDPMYNTRPTVDFSIATSSPPWESSVSMPDSPGMPTVMDPTYSDPSYDMGTSSNFDFVPQSVEPAYQFDVPAPMPEPEPVQMSYDDQDYWQWQQDWMDQQNDE